MRSNNAPSWVQQALSTAFTVLAIAIMLRIAWDLVRPLLPFIITLIVLVSVVSLLIHHRRSGW
jgi:hypothetical protein